MYFSQAKQAKNEWWRFLITITILLVIQMFIGAIPFYAILFIKSQQNIYDIYQFQKTLDFELIGMSQNFGLFILLIPHVLSAIALPVLMVKLHKYKPGDIFSAFGKFRWNRLWISAIIWLVLSILGELFIHQMHPDNYEFHFDAVKFIPLVFVTLLLIPFQAGFEELLFRGYFMQGLGILTRYRVTALILTAAGFGAMHSFNPEVNAFGFWNSMIFYMGFGLLAGILVIMDNGLEMAIGVHTVNNVFGCLFVTYKSSVLKTAALWEVNTLDIKLMNIGFIVMAVIFLVFMGIIFKWSGWKKILRPIVFTQPQL